MSERKVDVAIIGSGTAGLNAMGRVRRANKNFVLINGGEAGTTCARVGCMPSKAFIQVAESFHERTLFQRMGIAGADQLRLDIPQVLEYVRDLRDTFVDRVLTNSTDHLDPEQFIEQYARFIEPTLLELEDGSRIRADSIVIATGSTPIVPRPWLAFGDRIVTTDTLFELENLPKSMAVIGLGVIGLELGQALARLGVEITGLDRLETIGGLTDPEVSAVAVQELSREFPIWLGHPAEIRELADGRLEVRSEERVVVVEKILASMGRRPNIDRLGLHNIGVVLDPNGLPPYDWRTMQVGDLPIFLAGDVNGDRPILHEAGDEGKIAGHNAAHPFVTAFKRKVPLGIVFSDPNIVSVGARFRDLDPDRAVVGEMKIPPVGRALIMGRNRGLIRVYGDKFTGELLGAELMAPRAEHLGHELAWCIQNGMTVGDLLRMPFYHPVMEEALQAALHSLYSRLEPSAHNEGPLIEVEAI